jgi:hypothetical protein
MAKNSEREIAIKAFGGVWVVSWALLSAASWVASSGVAQVVPSAVQREQRPVGRRARPAAQRPDAFWELRWVVALALSSRP